MWMVGKPVRLVKKPTSFRTYNYNITKKLYQQVTKTLMTQSDMLYKLILITKNTLTNIMHA